MDCRVEPPGMLARAVGISRGCAVLCLPNVTSASGPRLPGRLQVFLDVLACQRF